MTATLDGVPKKIKSEPTAEQPVGDTPEYLVATALGGQLAPNSEKAWDVLGSGGEKLQVRARVVSDPAEPGQLQLSPFRSFGFDSAVIVLLSATDYAVSRASKVPRHVVEASAVYRKHVNGKVLFARPDIMGHADATDLTAALRAAQTGHEQGTYGEIDADLTLWTALRILQRVRVLHQRGYHAARILPGVSPSGGYWRVSISAAANFQTKDGYLELRDWDGAVNYSTGGGTEFAGGRADASTSPDVVADLILSALPRLPAAEDDPLYVEWYANLMRLVEEHHNLPIAYADYFDINRGWEIGWGSGIRYPTRLRPEHDRLAQRPLPSRLRCLLEAKARPLAGIKDHADLRELARTEGVELLRVFSGTSRRRPVRAGHSRTPTS